jgi:hypothetical protein
MYSLEIKVHSGLDRAKPALKLWYLAKAMSNTGIAHLSMQETCETLKVKERTIQHYLHQGKRFGYFRDWKRDGDKITVYYSSLISICLAYGFSIGYSAYTSTDKLPELKHVLTEISAQALQAASYHAARREQERLGNPKANLPLPEQYFPESPSLLSKGVLGFYGSVMLMGQSVVPYGASQVGIGKIIERHPQTIKRRLKSSLKQRIAYFDRMHLAELDLLRESWDAERGKFFPYQGLVYKLHTYIYAPQYHLCTCKAMKKKLQRARTADMKLRQAEVQERAKASLEGAEGAEKPPTGPITATAG